MTLTVTSASKRNTSFLLHLHLLPLSLLVLLLRFGAIIWINQHTQPSALNYCSTKIHIHLLLYHHKVEVPSALLPKLFSLKPLIFKTFFFILLVHEVGSESERKREKALIFTYHTSVNLFTSKEYSLASILLC